MIQVERKDVQLMTKEGTKLNQKLPRPDNNFPRGQIATGSSLWLNTNARLKLITF